MSSIRRSKSQSDLALSFKMADHSEASDLMMQDVTKRVRLKVSREGESPKMKKKKRVKKKESKRRASRERDQAQEEQEQTLRAQMMNIAADLQISSDDVRVDEGGKPQEEVSSVIAELIDEDVKVEEDVNDELDDVEVLPIVPQKRGNPYEDAPKKLDEIMGPLRAQKMASPPPEPKEVAVFYEKGDYSVSGLGEETRLKQIDVARKMAEKKKRMEEEKKSKREKMYSLPGKPAKFPKLKKKAESTESEPKFYPPPPPEEPLHTDPEATEEDISEMATDLIVLDEKPSRQKPTTTPSSPPQVTQKQLSPSLPVKVEMIPKEEQVEKWLSKAQHEPKSPQELISLDDQVDNGPIAKKQEAPPASKRKPTKFRPPPSPELPPAEDEELIPDDVADLDNREKLVTTADAPRVGINGFEKLGRMVLVAALEAGLDVVAVNDPFTPVNFMTYSLKYDLAHSPLPHRRKWEVRHTPNGQLMIAGKAVDVLANSDTSRIPWEALGISYVIETVEPLSDLAEARRHLRAAASSGSIKTGQFVGLSPEEVRAARAKRGLDCYAGLRRVIVAGPSPDSPLFAVGVNDQRVAGDEVVKACSSAPASALLPVLSVLHTQFGVKMCSFTLIKSVRQGKDIKCPANVAPSSHTRSSPRFDFAENLVPAEGLARALEIEVARVMPALSGRVSGVCVCAPTPSVSMLELTVWLESSEGSEVYRDACLALKRAAESAMKGILRYRMKMSEGKFLFGQRWNHQLSLTQVMQRAPSSPAKLILPWLTPSPGVKWATRPSRSSSGSTMKAATLPE